MNNNIVNFAVVMCGGRASNLNGINKSLVMHKGKTMISYVIESISETSIKKIILIANEENYKDIEKEINLCKNKGLFNKEFILIREPPKRFREVLLHLKDILDENPILVVAGNQPMKKDFLKKIIDAADENNPLFATLYKKDISNEFTFVGVSEEGFIHEGQEYVLQHPYILSKDILKKQIEEEFQYKIEETLKNISKNINIKGVIAEMPPEFDNEKMLKVTKEYLDLMQLQTIFLPGNSIVNKEWLEKSKIELSTLFPNIILHNYKHWEENKPVLDFDYEINVLKEKINSKKTLLFAKSVGAILIIKMIKKGLIHPEKCIFLGIPLSWALKNNFSLNEWIKDYNIPTLFIQNNKDPFCSYKELNNFLKENNVTNFKLVESEGENHDYEDYELIRKSILEFFNP